MLRPYAHLTPCRNWLPLPLDRRTELAAARVYVDTAPHADRRREAVAGQHVHEALDALRVGGRAVVARRWVEWDHVDVDQHPAQEPPQPVRDLRRVVLVRDERPLERDAAVR